MGVHNLWRLLELFAQRTTPEEWSGKCVAVDASVWIAQFRSAMASRGGGSVLARRGGGTNGHDEDGTVQRLLEGFLNRTLKLLFHNVVPVYVFDGPSSALKAREVQRRRDARRGLEQRSIAKQARRIIRAQAALGLLPHCDLSMLPRIAAAATQPSTGRHTASSPKKQKLTSPCRRFRAKRAQRRKSVVMIAPEGVSRQLTAEFLRESKSYLSTKRHGDATNASNLLLRCGSSVSSGSSMYLGPRAVLELSPIDDEAGSDIDGLLSHGSGLAEEQHPICLAASTEGHHDVLTALDGEYRRSGYTYEWFSPSQPDTEQRECEADATVNGRMSSCGDTDAVSRRSSTSTSARTVHINVVESPSSTSRASSERSASSSDDSVVCIGTHQDEGGFDSVFVRDQFPFGTRADVIDLDQSSNSVVECSAPPPTKKGENPPPGEVPIADKHTLVAPKPQRDKARTHQRQHRQVHLVPLELLHLVDLLKLMNVPYIISPGESDAQCAYLSESGVVDAVFSEDSDVVVHGASVVLRGFFTSPHMTAIRQSDLRQHGITKDVLLSLTELLGCDYTAGLGLTVPDALRVVSYCAPPMRRDDASQLDPNTMCVKDSMDTLRRVKDIAIAITSSMQSSCGTSAEKTTEDLDEALGDVSILQRAVVMQTRLSHKWPNWSAAILQHHNRSFPHEDVLRMFTADVAVDVQSLRARPTFPKLDWCELRRFMNANSLDHLWHRADVARRAIEQRDLLRAESAQAAEASRLGHMDISGFFMKPLQPAHHHAFAAAAMPVGYRSDTHATITEPSMNQQTRMQHRILESLHLLQHLRPQPPSSCL